MKSSSVHSLPLFLVVIVLLTTFSLLGCASEPSALESKSTSTHDLAIDELNFPDEAFRGYISDFVDINGDGVLSASEVDSVVSFGFDASLSTDEIHILDSSLDASIDTESEEETATVVNSRTAELSRERSTYCSISDLTGIEHFKNLKELDCSGLSISTLDVSSNIALEYLNCIGTNISSINVETCRALKSGWFDASVNVSYSEDVGQKLGELPISYGGEFQGYRNNARYDNPINWSCSYDAYGRLLVYDMSGYWDNDEYSYHFYYNNFGMSRYEKLTDDGVEVVSYDYDTLGRPVLQTTEGTRFYDGTVAYTYNDAGLLAEIARVPADRESPYGVRGTTSIAYDSNGDLSSETYVLPLEQLPVGSNTTYTEESSYSHQGGRLTGISTIHTDASGNVSTSESAYEYFSNYISCTYSSVSSTGVQNTSLSNGPSYDDSGYILESGERGENVATTFTCDEMGYITAMVCPPRNSTQAYIDYNLTSTYVKHLGSSEYENGRLNFPSVTICGNLSSQRSAYQGTNGYGLTASACVLLPMDKVKAHFGLTIRYILSGATYSQNGEWPWKTTY